MNTARKLADNHQVRIQEGDREKVVSLDLNEFVIGRDEAADIRIPGVGVSRRHAAIRISGTQVFVRDLGSGNGTFIGDRRLRIGEEVLVGAEERIALGKAATVSIIPRPPAPVRATLAKPTAPAAVAPVVPISKRTPAVAAGTSASLGAPQAVAPTSTSAAAPSPGVTSATAMFDLDDFRKQAVLEIEAVQLEAIRFAEVMKEESRQEADAYRGEVKREMDELREQAQLDANVFRDQAQQEVDALREQVQYEVDAIKQQAQREADGLRDQAQREADQVMASVQSEAEELRLDARRETEALEQIREQVEREAETLRKQALHEAETTKEEARRKAERIAEQARHESEMLKENARRERENTQADIEALSAAKDKLSTDTRQQEERLVTLRHEKAQLDSDVRERNQRRDTVAEEQAGLERRITESRETFHVLEVACSELEVKKREVEAAVKELGGASERLARIQGDVRLQEESLQKTQEELKGIQESIRRESNLQEVEERKRKALFDALDAEFRVKQLTLEAAVGEIELQRIEADRELQALVSQQSDTRLQAEKIKADADRHVAAATERVQALEKEAVKAHEKVEREQFEASRLRANITELDTALAALKKRGEQARDEALAAQAQAKLDQGTLLDFRKRSEAEVVQLRAQMETETKVARERLELDTAKLRQDARAMIENETLVAREALKKEFVDRGRGMERELADAKLKEMEKINLMQDEEKKLARSRMHFILDEIVRSAVELSRQKPLSELEDELKDAVRAALEGRTAGTLSTEGAERTRKFWKKIAVRASVPTGVVLFFIIFPGLPGMVRDQLLHTIAREKNDSGVFLEQIRQRGMKYQPDMDHNYRDSYSDNILYLEDYVEMKVSEKEQKDWTLILNDLIVGRLGLSDRVIPDFISAEAVMVKELFRIREGILPQYKEQGLAHMAETEKAEGDKILKLLQTPENYQKFRSLEKSYYLDYLKRKAAAK